MGGRRASRLPADPVEAEIEGLSHDGRGVARVEGKTVFVRGALTGERVRFRYLGRHRRYDEGLVEEVLRSASDRVAPRCAHVALCGGCSLQHLSPQAQLRDKQQILSDALTRIGKVEPLRWLAPLESPRPWGYRTKARLGVRLVPKKGRVLVGFREQGSGFVADLQRCEVLDPRVGGLLLALSELIGGLSIPDRIPQIEVALGDASAVLVFRVLDALTEQDRQRLRAFGQCHGLSIGVQSAGPESIQPLCDGSLELSYHLPEFGIEIRFGPSDFTQVNPELNRRMVAQALHLLAPEPEDRVLDLFCGLGNFTLPLARHAGQVSGVEVDQALLDRAAANARRNGLHNVDFHQADLYQEPLGQTTWLRRGFDKALLDPPRSGAAEVLALLPALGVRRLVYVSCYPSTLARDAGILAQLGYRLLAAGVMDMFPHTAHVESMALFERA